MGKKGKKGKKKKNDISYDKTAISYLKWRRLVYSFYTEWDNTDVYNCSENPNVCFIWSSTLCESGVCSKHNAFRFEVLKPIFQGTLMSVNKRRFVNQNGELGAYLIHIEDYLGELPPKLTSFQAHSLTLQ